MKLKKHGRQWHTSMNALLMIKYFKLNEIVEGQQLESMIFTRDDNKESLWGKDSVWGKDLFDSSKCLMRGGGDVTCDSIGFGASYIIQGKVHTKITINNYTNWINQSTS